MSLGKNLINMTKFEKLYNYQILATLVCDYCTSNKRDTKTMKSSILPKDCEQNENTRKEFKDPILIWYHTKLLSNM